MRPRQLAHRLRADEGGFTLIELLSALTILLTVLGTLTILMTSATSSEVDLTRRVQAQQEARLALEAMRRDVHCASTVTVASAASVTLTLPTGCPSAIGGTQFTWCTNGGGTRWALLRVPGAACSPSSARTEADYITSGNVFTLVRGGDKLDKLCVDFPVDLDPDDAKRAYRLKDQLVLRNSPRSSGTVTPC